MSIVLKSISEAISRIEYLLDQSKDRVVIGVVGKPGAGKSTFTAELIKNLSDIKPTLVPMDGYHLSNSQLASLGLSDRKGAFNTFDATGYVNLLRRINSESNTDIYFPVFHREIEESYAADGVVKVGCRLVITEGNYLLFDQGGWQAVKAELTEAWFIKVDDRIRVDRLIKRHELYGKDKQSAILWATGSDEINAKAVENNIVKADVIIEGF